MDDCSLLDEILVETKTLPHSRDIVPCQEEEKRPKYEPTMPLFLLRFAEEEWKPLEAEMGLLGLNACPAQSLEDLE
jgi:hypothetical protein